MDRVEEGVVGGACRVEAFVHRDRKSDKNLWCWRYRCQTHHCPRLGRGEEENKTKKHKKSSINK